MHIKPRGLARIGAIALNGARWKCKELMPAAWLTASFTAAVSMPNGRGYGYRWYLGAIPTDNGAGRVRWEDTVGAIENNGQRFPATAPGPCGGGHRR